MPVATQLEENARQESDVVESARCRHMGWASGLPVRDVNFFFLPGISPHLRFRSRVSHRYGSIRRFMLALRREDIVACYPKT